MALEARIEELVARHKTLDKAIDEEIRHPGSDDQRVAAMKKEKLRLKDQITLLGAGI